MLFRPWLFSALSVTSLLLESASALKPSHGRFSRQTHERKARASLELERRQAELNARQSSNATFMFYNDKTAPYFIQSLPDVPYDLGEIYSGNIPIDMNDTSRQLFFVFQPTIGAPVDEITLWMNGGPGCSSLEGFFQENGRWTWQPGTLAPLENPYSWVNLTNMFWVEQPIGTGFTIGTPTAQSQEEIAQDVIKAFKNFQEIFGIKNFSIYVSGESYAGRYVPYVSAAMLDAQDTDYYDLKGALVYDPCIGQFDYVQQEAPVVPLVVQNNNIFNFNASFIQQLEELHQSCGFADFIEEYLQFPASGVQPPKSFNFTSDASCDVFDMVYYAALQVNPCFDVYEINQQCPLLWDVLGFPTTLTYTPPGGQVYFDRPDVKAAMHAPSNITWGVCNGGVFVGDGTGPEGEGDISANPIEHVLPQVIEATNRVLVSNADYDMIIITNGTLLAIQNMTWNGKLGFDEQPATPIDITLPDLQYADVYAANNMTGVDGPQGIMGIQHYERGLMWAETYQAGHMQPQFQPRVAYRHLEWLLGRTETI